jgi:ribosomal protein S18 acetylase RimI-like enzyme
LTQPKIRVAAESDEASIAAVLALAFSTDPGARWAWPHPQQLLANFPAFVKAFAGAAFSKGTAYYVDGYAGAALWLPPDAGPDEEALDALMQRSAAEQTLKDLLAVFDRMRGYHPSGPHWYLPLIGVDPIQQGSGLGSALMRHALARCDGEGKPAFLESSNPRNVSLYERHGFEMLGRIQVGSSPTLFPMLRKAR